MLQDANLGAVDDKGAVLSPTAAACQPCRHETPSIIIDFFVLVAVVVLPDGTIILSSSSGSPGMRIT